jgi:tetratricopeptide (TPR) repeat protein
MPRYSRAHYYRAVCLYFLGREREARRGLDRALELDSGIEKEMGLAGDLMVKVGNYDGAIAEIERVIADEPMNASVYATLGAAYLHKGDVQRARDLFERSLEIKPELTESLVYMGDILRNEGDLRGAARSYRKARDLSPGFADVRFRLGEVYLAMEDGEKAAAELEEAIKINQNFVEARLAMSWAQRRLGNEEEALKQLDEILNIDPHNVIANAQKKTFLLDRPSTGRRRSDR